MRIKYRLLIALFLLSAPSGLWAQACALNVASGSVTLSSGTYNYCSLSVSLGATLVISGQVFLDVTGDADIEGTVQGTGNGYPSGGSDPGTGASTPMVVGWGTAGGGGHGGAGGNGSPGPMDPGSQGGVTTDNPVEPVMEGGGGGNDALGGAGGTGGAAFILVADGNVTVNGAIAMDGAPGVAYGGGGGAGGTISIDGAGVFGAGSLSALGGNGSPIFGGMGGGGCIRVCAAGGPPSGFTGSVNVSGPGAGTYYSCNPATATSTDTPVFTPTATASPTLTNTPTATPTLTPIFTQTPSLTPTLTVTWTPTSTQVSETFSIPKNLFQPSQGPVSIYVSTNQYPGTLKLDIYNSAGEFVKSLEDGRQLTGPYQNTYSWTGTNWKGDNVADGVYLFILSEPFGVKRARLVLVR